jgi:hypothetical protein
MAVVSKVQALGGVDPLLVQAPTDPTIVFRTGGVYQAGEEALDVEEEVTTITTTQT